jgi:DnaJ like chaperone protein
MPNRHSGPERIAAQHFVGMVAARGVERTVGFSHGPAMGLWATIVGGAAGLALGGPIGGLIGAAAGLGVDRYVIDPAVASQRPGGGDPTQSIAFTIGVVALAAKMAKADGEVTRDEIGAFREMFSVDESEVEHVTRVFDLARRSVDGFESYARQIARLFPPGSPVLEQLLDSLFHIAKADAAIHDAELEYLARVAEIFGFDRAAFARIRTTHVGDAGCASDPYCILGVEPDADGATIQAAYRDLVKQHHPDALIGQGMPAEAVAIANAKLAAINEAWTAVRQERGL